MVASEDVEMDDEEDEEAIDEVEDDEEVVFVAVRPQDVPLPETPAVAVSPLPPRPQIGTDAIPHPGSSSQSYSRLVPPRQYRARPLSIRLEAQRSRASDGDSLSSRRLRATVSRGLQVDDPRRCQDGQHSRRCVGEDQSSPCSGAGCCRPSSSDPCRESTFPPSWYARTDVSMIGCRPVCHGGRR